MAEQRDTIQQLRNNLMLLAQEYVPDLSEYKDRFMRTPLGLLSQGNVSGAVDELGAAAQGRVQAMMNPESALQTGFDFMGGGLLGTTAYHGTPHIFSKFDASKVGTGQGAQSYGHGIYFAENPAVAKEYQRQLSGWQPGTQSTINQSGGDLDIAINEAQRKIKHYQGLLESGNVPKERAKSLLDINTNKLKDLQAIKAGIPESKGSFYTVDIPDEYIPKMINWDKAIGQQSPEVKQAIQNTRKDLTENNIADLGGDTSLLYGDDVSVEQFLNTWSALKGADDAGEKLLNKYGVPGVKYLDEGSRNTFKAQLTYKGKPYSDVVEFKSKNLLDDYIKENKAKGFGVDIIPGTSNYVVFDPTNVKILERK